MNTDINWILKCIDSCTNEFQLNCCLRLIECFSIKYPDNPEPLSIMRLRIMDKQVFIMPIA